MRTGKITLGIIKTTKRLAELIKNCWKNVRYIGIFGKQIKIVHNGRCALASDKKILVYDEPTSGLDYTRMLDVAEGFLMRVKKTEKEIR